jgi:hypothetical protein
VVSNELREPIRSHHDIGDRKVPYACDQASFVQLTLALSDPHLQYYESLAKCASASGHAVDLLEMRTALATGSLSPTHSLPPFSSSPPLPFRNGRRGPSDDEIQYFDVREQEERIRWQDRDGIRPEKRVEARCHLPPHVP